MTEDPAELIRQARQLVAGQQFAEAASLLQQAANHAPDSFDAHYLLAGCLGQLGQIAEAIDTARHAVGLDPESPPAYYNLGLLLRGCGKTRDAQNALMCALAIDPAYERARAALDSITPPLSPTWLATLRTNGRSAYKAAFEALGESANPRASEVLVSWLRDPDDSIRRAAAEALAKLGDPRSVGPLIELVAKGGPGTATTAFLALMEMQKRDRLLTRRAGEAILAAIAEDCREIGHLSCLLIEIDSVLLDQAHCERAAPHLVRALLRVSPSDERTVILGLKHIAPASIDPLIRMLESDVGRHPNPAAKALGEVGDARGAPPLIAALKGDQRYLRPAAAEALGGIRDPIVVEPLIAALEHNDPRVAIAAAHSLGRVGDARAIPALKRHLHDARSEEFHKAMTEALASIGAPDAFEMLMADFERRRGEAAVAALGRLKDERAVEPILAYTRMFRPNDNWWWDVSERDAIAKALGEIGGEQAVLGLLDLARDREWAEFARRGLETALAGPKENIPEATLLRAAQLPNLHGFVIHVSSSGDHQRSPHLYDCAQIRELAGLELAARRRQIR